MLLKNSPQVAKRKRAQFTKIGLISSLILLLAMFGAIAHAQAQSVKTAAGDAVAAVYDAGGMLRCIENPSRPDDTIVLFWDQNMHYPRTVYGTSVRSVPSAFNNRRIGHSCKAWQTYVNAIQLNPLWDSAGYDVIQDHQVGIQVRDQAYVWGPEVQSRVTQAQLGSNVFHELTAEGYLAAHPIAPGQFTREFNRQMTQAYGIGFTADVYKAWLETQPGNSEFKNKVLASIASFRTHSNHALAARFSKYKVLIAQGFMQTTEKNRLQALLDELRKLGVENAMMDFDPLGPLAYNIPLFRERIRKELSNGQNLILISASKGAPELLTALADLNMDAFQPLTRFQGRVAAVVTLAGMYQGSFLVDWAGGFPQSLFIRSSLDGAAEDSGLKIQTLTGFFDMSSAVLQKQAAFYRPLLPKLHYYDFVGVLTHTGLARDSEIGMLQNQLTLPHVNFHGANDGYIEYPGTELPREWGLNSTDVVFDSSHAILDGYYNGLDLQDPKTSGLVIEGIFQTILDDIAKFGL